jgi:hypothetical protein
MPSIRSINISWPAVMHLVFLGAQQHLEAGFGWRRHARREFDAFREKVVGLALQPLCPSLPFVAQKSLFLSRRPTKIRPVAISNVCRGMCRTLRATMLWGDPTR